MAGIALRGSDAHLHAFLIASAARARRMGRALQKRGCTLGTIARLERMAEFCETEAALLARERS
jgi:hypothetical protein